MQLCCKLEYSVAQTCHLYTHLCGCFPVSQAWKALTPYLHQLEPSLFFNAQLKFHLLQSLSLSPGRTSSLLRDSWVFIQASTHDTYRFFLQVNYLGQCFMPPTIFHASYPSDRSDRRENPRQQFLRGQRQRGTLGSVGTQRTGSNPAWESRQAAWLM